MEPVLEETGFELVDVEYLSDRGRWILRVFMDKEGGVTIEDCARASREIGDLIDVKDLIDHEYVLEVSSPGLDRPLKKEKDFVRAVGKKIKLRTVKPVEGRRNYFGYLRGFQDRVLHLEVDPGGLVSLPLHEVEKANLVYEFKD